jgi:hypothetical protein
MLFPQWTPDGRNAWAKFCTALFGAANLCGKESTEKHRAKRREEKKYFILITGYRWLFNNWFIQKDKFYLLVAYTIKINDKCFIIQFQGKMRIIMLQTHIFGIKSPAHINIFGAGRLFLFNINLSFKNFLIFILMS